jgi:outer membrane protein TolC
MAMRSGAKLLVGRDANSGLVKSPISSTGSDGTIYAGIKLPLLRGAGVNDKSIAELQAKLGLPLADAAITQVIVASKAAAGGAYWEWVAAGRKLTVARDLLALAVLRAKQIAREVELGAQPPIAITEAEQEVRRREAGLNKAERDVQKASIKLAGYLWQDDGTPLPPPAAEQLPSEMPAPAFLDAARLQVSREGALAKRPEILAIALQLGAVSLDERLALNDGRPDLSLVLQPGQDMGRLGIGETLKAGINFSVPLGRWDASGRRDTARAKTIKLTQDRELTKRQVLLEVDDAWSAILAAVERFHATDAEVALAKQLEVGERKRFAEGDSTLFLVNQRERATAEAIGRLIDIQLEYQQALLALDAASIAL